MPSSALARHLPALATAAACIAIACVAASPVNSLGKGGGKAATADQVPADAGYTAAQCVDLTDDVPCGGQYVLACCTDSACGYVVTDGTSLSAAFQCSSTSDCDAAADAVLGYCADGDSGRGGDTGYDSIRARQRILRASGKP